MFMKLANFLIKMRRSKWSSAIKSIVPERLRRAAWNVVAKENEFQVLGSRMVIPESCRMPDLILDIYEPQVTACLKFLLKPGMIFCDVGANLGVFTLFAAKLVGPKGHVFAFEPVPSNFHALKHNVEINNQANVTCISKAVAETNGVSKLYLSDYNGSHSLIDNPAAFSGIVIDVKTVRLDSLEGLNHIDVLKIDVEGFELQVIRSLGSLKPIIILEYFSERISRSGLDGIAFISELKALGYLSLYNLSNPEVGIEPIIQNQDVVVNLLASTQKIPGFKGINLLTNTFTS